MAYETLFKYFKIVQYDACHVLFAKYRLSSKRASEMYGTTQTNKTLQTSKAFLFI